MKTIMLTSSVPGEGKTVTATNLAAIIAETGKKVLLVDCDLHRPMVDRVLGLGKEKGLTSILAEGATLEECRQKVIVEGSATDTLDVITAGPRTASPSVLLGSDAMNRFLTRARSEYDWVLADTPPVLFVSDAAILSVPCDGVIVVVKSGTNSMSMLGRCTEQLRTVNAKVIGSILNGMLVSRIGRYYSRYYYYGYSRYAPDYQRSYYGHHHDDEEEDAS